jgi:Family of unknown function (DUF6594)
MVSIPAKRGTLEYFKLEGKIFENWSQNQSLPGRQMDGYDKLAAFIAADPRLSMFRRFSFLDLYLQAELVNLETQLRHCPRGHKVRRCRKGSISVFCMASQAIIPVSGSEASHSVVESAGNPQNAEGI